MENIKVIQVGLGAVGKGVTKALVDRKGVEIVGALDIARDKVGKDLGEVADINKQLGVIVTDDADTLFSRTHADVVINSTTYSPLRDLYQEITKPIEQGMNIITSSVEGSRPFYADLGIATELEKLLRKHGVTYFGTGDTTAHDRVIMAFIEQCTEVHKIEFTTHGNLEGTSQAAQRSYGIGLTPEEYQRQMEEGSIVRLPTPEQEVAMISERLGWQLDEVRERIEPSFGEDGRIIGMTMIYEGIKDGKVKIERKKENLPDNKGSYNIIIEGVPSFNVVNHVLRFGTSTTVGCLVNAIPHVVNAPPGIIRALDLPLSFFAG